jgi:sucrose-6-phosphatase
MSPDSRILLACDLDRTLLPNGPQPESPQARALFRGVCAQPEIALVYVTGRDRSRIEAAMEEYALPRPRFVIGDVGASLYRIDDDDWQLQEDWRQVILPDWSGRGHAELAAILRDLPALRLQEPSRQGECKLSFYAPPLQPPAGLLSEVRERLKDSGVRVNLIWSIDETTRTGLLDILPASAGKLHALEFLRERLGIPLTRTVFAGDSGNDLEVLISDVPSVLVANAPLDVVAHAATRADPAKLYLAYGGFLGMNGHYSAGVLEGLAHFIPETRAWMESSDPRQGF